MTETTTPTGAMPAAAGAMPAQSYPVGPGWAAYRVPFLTSIDARTVGVCFEGEPAGGATPPPATPPATPPAAPPPAATPPATPPAPPATGAPAATPPTTGDGYPEGMGDAGKRALDAEREARKTAERELEKLKTAALSEGEKAVKEATNAATAAERAKWQSSIRAVRVEAALRVAGATNETLLDLALRSDLISALKVDEAGKVTDLDKAVEQLKKDIPEMFTKPGAGTVTAGAQTGQPGQAKDLESAIAAHYTKH